MKNFKTPLSVKIAVSVFFLFSLISIVSNVVDGFISIYNSTYSYRLDYKSLEQNQITTFDNNYLIFKDKSNIASLNKETFIKVTEIIMSARKDGMSVAWKWVSENQPIPYGEFTQFYKDLSSFTSSRFAENNMIERSKQSIVKEHNKLIMTFPGNLYNHFLKIDPMVYKEGFVSDDTKSLFNIR